MLDLDYYKQKHFPGLLPRKQPQESRIWIVTTGTLICITRDAGLAGLLDLNFYHRNILLLSRAGPGILDLNCYHQKQYAGLLPGKQAKHPELGIVSTRNITLTQKAGSGILDLDCQHRNKFCIVTNRNNTMDCYHQKHYSGKSYPGLLPPEETLYQIVTTEQIILDFYHQKHYSGLLPGMTLAQKSATTRMMPRPPANTMSSMLRTSQGISKHLN